MLPKPYDIRRCVGEAFVDSSSPAALLPAFGHKKSHLPTPQSSPSNAGAYAPSLNGGYTSPSAPVDRDRDAQRSHVHRRASPASATASFMTPESSPLLPRKMMASDSPVAGPSSVPHTPSRHELAKIAGDPSAGTVISSLAPAPIITTPVSARSRLSSPFSDRIDRRSSPMPFKADSPMATPRPMTPPPLATPVPHRALGGEMQRIQLQLAADRAERLAEKEARRPEYLVREKRPRSDDIPTLDELDAASATLGVTETPMKGRRLQLFQATSEETFEQSLLAGGYPGYGQSPAYKSGEPHTAMQHGTNRGALSQRALHWLQQATPGDPGPSIAAPMPPVSSPSAEPPELPTEQQIQKQRRLDAFREKKDINVPKLYPVEVEGRGRLLLDVPPPGSAAARTETPVKRRPNKRKRRRGSRRGVAPEEPEDAPPVRPNWPDTVFPWCLREQERMHTESLAQEERLARIARFLDRASDSDDDSGADAEELWPPLQTHEDDQVAHPRGRGKMVPLRSDRGKENVLVPSDPADARAALLSKRSVRSLAFRRTIAPGASLGLEDVRCVPGCTRGDDGTALVQCDMCTEWFHLSCIGVTHVAELGREEDPWFCGMCASRSYAYTEPTLVPTDDRPARSGDELFLQHAHAQQALFESPAPRTPVRRRLNDEDEDNIGMTHEFSTRSTHGAPRTPDSGARAVRVYGTPRAYALAFDKHGFNEESPFDPTTTPSRGIQFSGGPPPTLGLSTPKGGGLWAMRGRATPTPTFGGLGLGRVSADGWGVGVGDAGGLRKLNWNDGRHMEATAGAHSRGGPDDTPITRAPRLAEGRTWDSPGFAPKRARTPAGWRNSSRDGDVLMKSEG